MGVLSLTNRKLRIVEMNFSDFSLANLESLLYPGGLANFEGWFSGTLLFIWRFMVKKLSRGCGKSQLDAAHQLTLQLQAHPRLLTKIV